MTSSPYIRVLALSGALLSLAACGYHRGDRAASGALIGGAAGAGIAALTGGAPLVGGLPSAPAPAPSAVR